MRKFKLFLIIFTLIVVGYMIYLPISAHKKVIKASNKFEFIESDINETLVLEANENHDENITEIVPLNISDTIDKQIVVGFLKSKSKSVEKNIITLHNGTINGVNFEEIFCRADAFSKGEFMPKKNINKYYRFDNAKFNKNSKRSIYKNLEIDTENFKFFANNIDLNNRSKAILKMKKMFRNNCGVNERYLEIEIPLWCSYKNGGLSCALDLKNLITLLSGVEAKTTKKVIKEEIIELRNNLDLSHKEYLRHIENDNLDNLKQEFKSRSKQKFNIEEFDLRDLFVP